jgi:mono/diheme cytochrome c family protein
MDDSPKWKPQTGSEFFADGRSMRQPPPGAVAFGRVALVSDAGWAAPWMTQRADLLREDDAFYTGYTGIAADGKFQYVDRIPVSVDAALIARGADRFGIYCIVCHGPAGDGKGMVGPPRWSVPIPSWHDPKYRDPNEPDGKNKDGFLFYTARNGVPGAGGNILPTDTPDERRLKHEQLKMPGYAHALSERDTWAIVAYIRVLQEARLGTPADIPADKRADLDRERERLIREAPPPAPATPPASPVPGGTP